MPKFFTKDPIINPWEASLPKLDPTHEIEEPSQKSEVGSRKSDEDENPVRILLQWRAPSRPFRAKDRSYYTTITIIIILLILIALLAQEYLLVGALIAFSFVIYVLGFHPPEDLDYKISTQGVTIGEHFYFWDELDSFWLAEKDGSPVLHILTRLRFPGQLILVLDQTDQERFKQVIAKYLPYHEIAPKSLIDSWSNWLQKLFPLEKTV